MSKKDDQGKPRPSLIPSAAILEMGWCLAYGAEKYGEGPDESNWRTVSNPRSRYLDAAIRHIYAYVDGEEADGESGYHHLAHAMCNLAFILGFDCG